MKKMYSLSLLLMIIVLTASAASILAKKDIMGDWKYEVTTAPEGYQKGVITLTENKSVLVGEVMFDSGYKVQFRTVTIEGETLKVELYVENENVTLIAKIVGGKMEGTVDSSQGKMIFKAEKKLKVG
jgi:hypothetical protein